MFLGENVNGEKYCYLFDDVEMRNFESSYMF
jgi:hypothetical protein